MIAGRMTDRIELLRPRVPVSASGSEKIIFESEGFIHAERVKFSGTYRIEVGEYFPDYRAEFNIRSAHNVEENWRVRYNGTDYVVANIIPNRRRGMKTLICDKINP